MFFNLPQFLIDNLLPNIPLFIRFLLSALSPHQSLYYLSCLLPCPSSISFHRMALKQNIIEVRACVCMWFPANHSSIRNSLKATLCHGRWDKTADGTLAFLPVLFRKSCMSFGSGAGSRSSGQRDKRPGSGVRSFQNKCKWMSLLSKLTAAHYNTHLLVDSHSCLISHGHLWHYHSSRLNASGHKNEETFNPHIFWASVSCSSSWFHLHHFCGAEINDRSHFLLKNQCH